MKKMAVFFCVHFGLKRECESEVYRIKPIWSKNVLSHHVIPLGKDVRQRCCSGEADPDSCKTFLNQWNLFAANCPDSELWILIIFKKMKKNVIILQSWNIGKLLTVFSSALKWNKHLKNLWDFFSLCLKILLKCLQSTKLFKPIKIQK